MVKMHLVAKEEQAACSMVLHAEQVQENACFKHEKLYGHSNEHHN